MSGRPVVAGRSEPQSPFASRHFASLLVDAPLPVHRRVDGTLLFLDVAGFTRLTERLAAHGSVGAEEVTAVVDGGLGSQITAVTRYGGDVLSFGGDALLVLFDGEDHECRAVHASAAAQEAVRARGPLTTPVGTVILQVATGVESGPVDLVLAGALQPELLVLGPTVDSVLDLESQAGDGQVLLGREVADRLGLGLAADGETLRLTPARLRRIGPAAASAAPDTGPRSVSAPAAIHELLSAEETQHRDVVVGFVRLTGLTSALGTAPSELVGALDDLLRISDELCARHSVARWGVDVDRDAAKLIYVAGAPVSQGDHGDRLLAALVELVQASPLPAAAGLQAGRVFMTPVGTSARQSWTVMGDVVNVASRLAHRAEPGQVLATQLLLDRTRGSWSTSGADAISVKGRRAALPIVHVDGPADGRPQDRAGDGERDLGLVGRDAELATLVEAVRRARTTGGTVELAGPAGIGKSRLLQAVIDDVESDARDRVRLEVNATTYAQPSPFLALRGPLRRLVTDRPQDEAGTASDLWRVVLEKDPGLAPWLPLIGEVWRVSYPETPETARIEPAFRRSVQLNYAVAALRSLLPAGSITVVEDRHWLDSASRDLLDRMAGQSDHPWTVLATTRTDDADGDVAGEQPDVVRVELGPLPPDAALGVARRAHPGLTYPEAEVVARRAAGNPLFARELADALAEGRADIDELPATVDSLFVSVIDALSPARRLLLRRAAVLGSRAPRSLVADLIEADPVTALPGLVVAEGRQVRFRHDLLRQAAYAALPHRTRRELHSRAVDLLLTSRVDVEAEERADLLATHAHRAGRWPESWDWSRTAASNAWDRGATHEALQLWIQAEAAARRCPDADPDTLREVLLHTADAAERVGSADLARRALAGAARLSPTPVASAEVMRRWGGHYLRFGSTQRGYRWVTRALRLIEDEPGRAAALERIRLQIGQADYFLQRSRIDEMATVVDAALAEARRQGERSLECQALTVLSWGLASSNDPRTRETIDQALLTATAVGDPGLLAAAHGVADNYYYAFDWDISVQHALRARDLRLEMGDLRQAGISSHNAASAFIYRGRLDEAEQMLRQSLDWWGAAGFPLGIIMSTVNLAHIALLRRDHDSCRRHLERARALHRGTGLTQAETEIVCREIELELWTDPPRAWALIEESASMPGLREDSYMQAVHGFLRARAHLITGRVEEALAALAKTIVATRKLDDQLVLGLALVLHGSHAPDPDEQREGGEVLTKLGVDPSLHLTPAELTVPASG